MTKWKVIAIIFIALFIIETAYVSWGVWLVKSEENKINECYYGICEEYPEAFYKEKICYCYDYDLLGELKVVKIEYMKK